MRRIDFLFAVPQERAQLARLLPAAIPGAAFRHASVLYRTAGQAHLRLAVGGMGAKCAARAAEELLSSQPPDLLVITGVAGALDPALRIGEVVVASAVLSEAGTMAPRNGLLSPTPGARVGSLLSLDRVLISAAQKHQARGEHPEPPLAVEMETAAVARVAERFGIPWTAVRAVSDTANEALPVDFNALRTPDGNLPTSRIAGYALAHPLCIPGLIRLGRNTNTAAEALARFLHQWVSSLPVSDNGPGVLE